MSDQVPVPEVHSPATARGIGGIGSAVGIAAVASLALLLVLRRLLGPDPYALFMTVWGVLFGISTAITVLEQEVSRRASHDEVVGTPSDLGSVRVGIVGLVAVVVLHVVILIIPQVRTRLYGTDHTWTLAAIVIAATLGFVAQYWVRGMLIGHGRVRPYSTLLLVEAFSRIGTLGLLWLAFSPVSIVSAVVATMTGSFAWLLVARRARRELDTSRPSPDAWGAIIRRTLVLGGGLALMSLLLTAYPSVAALVLGGSAGLGPVFSVITATRIPLVMVTPLQTVTIPLVVHTVERKGVGGLTPLLVKGGAILAVIALAGLGLGWWLGPWVVRLMFAFDVPAWSVAAISAGSVLIGAAQLLVAVLVALDRHLAAALTWAIGAAVAVVVLATMAGSGTAVVTASLTAASVAVALASTVAVILTVRQAFPAAH